MARKGKGRDAASESAEFKAFEANLKEIIKVPKKELERREAQWKSTKSK